LDALSSSSVGRGEKDEQQPAGFQLHRGPEGKAPMVTAFPITYRRE
jgi:hypothetical protein